MMVSATADSTNVPLIFGRVNAPAPEQVGAPGTQVVAAPALAWTMLPVGFGGTAGTLLMGLIRPSKRVKDRRTTLWLVPMLLLLTLGMAGCANPVNYKIYTITVTGTNSTGGTVLTQSATVALTLAQ
jgi:hypothetical protein